MSGWLLDADQNTASQPTSDLSNFIGLIVTAKFRSVFAGMSWGILLRSLFVLRNEVSGSKTQEACVKEQPHFTYTSGLTTSRPTAV